MQFDFQIMDPSMPGELEVNVQNERNSGTGRRSSFLGRVVVPVSTVPPKAESVRWYPLQKRGLFSHIKGDLGSVSTMVSTFVCVVGKSQRASAPEADMKTMDMSEYC